MLNSTMNASPLWIEIILLNMDLYIVQGRKAWCTNWGNCHNCSCTYLTGSYPNLSSGALCKNEGCILCPLLVENLTGLDRSSSSWSSWLGTCRETLGTLDFSLCEMINGVDVGELTSAGCSVVSLNVNYQCYYNRFYCIQILVYAMTFCQNISPRCFCSDKMWPNSTPRSSGAMSNVKTWLCLAVSCLLGKNFKPLKNRSTFNIFRILECLHLQLHCKMEDIEYISLSNKISCLFWSILKLIF